MTADPNPAPEPTPTPGAPAPTPTGPAPQPTPTDPAPAAVDDGKGGKDAILADLAKERDKRQAAETAVQEAATKQQEFLDGIAKLVGLKNDEPPTAEKLAEQITSEQTKTAEAETGRLNAERALAVFKAAATPEVGGNPLTLLDSSSFMGTIKDLDPTDTEAISAAVTKAIEANPAFKATPTTPSFNGGARPSPAPQSTGTLGGAIAGKLAAQSR